MGEVIVITSGKGGVGKTTTTANIGAGLSWLGKKVIVIDTDLGLRNLDVVMGLENQIVYNLVDVIEGTCRLKQAAIRDRRYENLYLLPSAQTKDKSAISPEQMKKLCEELKKQFDYKEYGGAVMLGVKKPVIKSHGSADARTFKNAIKQAIWFLDNNLISSIEKEFSINTQEE